MPAASSKQPAELLTIGETMPLVEAAGGVGVALGSASDNETQIAKLGVVLSTPDGAAA